MRALCACTVSSCTDRCPNGQYGTNCMNKCACENQADCDVTTGVCTCGPGFMGPLCSLPCPFGKYGTNCKNACTCANDAGCDPVTGACVCRAGWTGDQCEKRCEVGRVNTLYPRIQIYVQPGTFGVGCAYKCAGCATCDAVSGRCDGDTCAEGKWGDGCSKCARTHARPSHDGTVLQRVKWAPSARNVPNDAM
jgi:hypothetical protein